MNRYLLIILLEEIQSALGRTVDRLRSEEFLSGKYEPTELRDEADFFALIDTLDSQARASFPSGPLPAQDTSDVRSRTCATHKGLDISLPAENLGEEQ